jgi:hypothetical protein
MANRSSLPEGHDETGMDSFKTPHAGPVGYQLGLSSLVTIRYMMNIIDVISYEATIMINLANRGISLLTKGGKTLTMKLRIQVPCTDVLIIQHQLYFPS